MIDTAKLETMANELQSMIDSVADANEARKVQSIVGLLSRYAYHRTECMEANELNVTDRLDFDVQAMIRIDDRLVKALRAVKK